MNCNTISYLDDGNHVHCQLPVNHWGEHFCKYPGGTVRWETLAERNQNVLNQYYVSDISATDDNWPWTGILPSVWIPDSTNAVNGVTAVDAQTIVYVNGSGNFA